MASRVRSQLKARTILTRRLQAECFACGDHPRSGRSRHCEECRTRFRRLRKAQAQRTRRASDRSEPDVERLIEDLSRVGSRLNDYLLKERAIAESEGRTISSVQRDAEFLVERVKALVNLAVVRGFKSEPKRNREGH